jgi:hypothetical protein
MPTIRTFPTGTVDERVQSIDIDTSGAGAVAQALSNLGAEGEKLANNLIRERTINEANEYERNSLDKMDVERQRQFQSLSTQMDPNNGRIIKARDEAGKPVEWGDTLYKEMENWELESEDRMLLNAPTDVAAEKFKRSNGATRNASLLRYDSYQHGEMVLRRKTVHADTNDTRAKRVQSLDPSLPGSESATSRGTKELMNMERDYLNDNLLSDNEKRLGIKTDGNKIANGTVYNNYTEGNLKEMAQNIELARMLNDEEFKGDAKKLIEDALGRPVDRVGVLKDGTIFGEKKSDDIAPGKIYRMTMNEDGSITEEVVEEKAFAAETKFAFEPIDVEGEAPENLIIKNLTPAQQREWGNKLLSKMKQKQKESDRRLVAEHQSLIAGLNSTDINSRIRPDFLDDNNTATQLFKNHIAKIDMSGISATAKDDMKVEAYGAYIGGSMKDSMTWDTVSGAQAKASNSPAMIEKILRQEGQTDLADDPLFKKKVAVSTQNSLKNYANERNKHIHKSEYIAANDPKFRKYQGEMDNSPQAHKRYMEYTDSRFDQMGVPPHMRQKYTGEYLAFQKSTLEGFLDPSQGESGQARAVEWMMKNKINKGKDFVGFMELLEGKGLDSTLKAAALMPNNQVGMSAAKKLINAYVNKDGINKAYNARSKEEGTSFESSDKLRGRVASLMGDHINYVARRANTSADITKMGDLIEGITTVAKDNALRFNKSTDAPQVAFNETLSNTSTIAKSGDNLIIWNNGELEALGLNQGQANAITKYYSKPESIIDKVDLRQTINSNISAQLKDLNLSPAEEDKKLKEWFTKENLGRLKPDKMSDRIIFYLERDGRSVPVLNKDGNQLSISIDEVKNDPGFKELSGSFWFNFFGKGQIGNLE